MMSIGTFYLPAAALVVAAAVLTPGSDRARDAD